MNIYSRMIDLLQRNLSASGIDQVRAITASVSVVEELRAEIGGDNLYLPKKNDVTRKAGKGSRDSRRIQRSEYR